MVGLDVSSPTIRGLEGFTTFLFVVGYALSGYRLYRRYIIRRLWWDDCWAFVTFIMAVLMLVFFWLNYKATSQRAKAVNSWGSPLALPLVVWPARISIALSIVRVLSPGKARSTGIVMTTLFFAVWAGLVGAKLGICGRDVSWMNQLHPNCPLPRHFGITQVSFEIVSSALLVIFPLYVLWDVDLSAGKRGLILGTFGLNFTLAVFAALHVVYFYKVDPNLLYMTGSLEGAMSLILCNLLVVMTRFYQLYTKSSSSNELDDYYNTDAETGLTTPSTTNKDRIPLGRVSLTTVEWTQPETTFTSTAPSIDSQASSISERTEERRKAERARSSS